MAGHSQWANIKRQKARVDAVTKMSRAIIVAARTGGMDLAGNFQLRTAIDQAKAAGIPNDNIDRAIAKGAGKLGAEGDSLEAIWSSQSGLDVERSRCRSVILRTLCCDRSAHFAMLVGWIY